ncbi:unnamed protein product [Paramecium octaurelia]|uniref:Uncharacterized protein n=1 Tax=Paramecium octaurelia TaxID=43137 RepID=A0A8S1VRN6_PAROT|nr:unnamed protein product [Paramecium octaurelia]
MIMKRKKRFIINILCNKKIIEFRKLIFHLTALDEIYIKCGSNSLHLLVLMKVDLKQQCFEILNLEYRIVRSKFMRYDQVDFILTMALLLE